MNVMLTRAMRRIGRRLPFVLPALLLATTVSSIVIPNLFPFLDPTGLVATYNSAGPINEDNNPFFENLGTNGRVCATCHQASDGMGLNGANVRTRFLATRGSDPLFAPVDGANCPNASRSNPADHSLLLSHGLIRVFLPMPANAQFTVSVIHDPYGCAILTDATGVQNVSVYRRPLPTTNLRYLSTIMFDGRESLTLPLNSPSTFQANLLADLMHQSLDATVTHAQAATPPTEAQQSAIVAFELGLNSSQLLDFNAGLLSSYGATGGPYNLSQLNYYPGINDSLGHDPEGGTFNSSAFSLFQSWANPPSNFGFFQGDAGTTARERIAAGEVLFNTRALTISSVRGLNDNSALGTVPVAPFQGTCTTCHDTPNVGDHSLPLPLDIGTVHDPIHESDPLIANGLSQLDFPDLPVYAISGCANPFATAPSAEPYVIYTTDPGKALITGLCSDVNRIKGPILRGLAARAPYFHNGAAQDLTQLVNFYNQRFQMNLTDEEKSELIVFLNSL
jgi:cytochrome c peroxidase